MVAENQELHPVTGLANDEEIWQGMQLTLPVRLQILRLIAAGAPAVALNDLHLSDDLEGNSVFRIKKIGATRYMVPKRFERMVEFFLRREPWVENPAGVQTITQRLAGRGNCLMSGGPGTGKSYQISELVDYLGKQPTERPLRVTIAAPTGKSAARFSHLTPASGVLLEWSTIHRLLGLSGDLAEPRFSHRNPLGIDLLIVDEISMVDLGLFTWLIDALPDHARVLLAGDLGQLPAVDGIPLDNCLAFLEQSNLVTRIHLTQVHRFTESRAQTYRRIAETGLTAIGSESEGVAVSVVRNAAEARQYVLRHIMDFFGAARAEELRRRLREEFAPDAAADLIRTVFEWQKTKMVLTTRREGILGSENLNKLLTTKLAETMPDRSLMPIIITANNYRLGVFNGDTGFIAVHKGREYAVINASEGNVVCLPLQELAGWQLAFAITVHKSQGSEYDEVLVAYEDKPGEEAADHRLLYTAVTRAKNTATVIRINATGKNP